MKPLVDLNVTNVDMDSFTEKGRNGAALKVSSNDETVFSATPALEIGTQWGHPGGILTRPYVRGGVSFYSDADFPICGVCGGTGGPVHHQWPDRRRSGRCLGRRQLPGGGGGC